MTKQNQDAWVQLHAAVSSDVAERQRPSEEHNEPKVASSLMHAWRPKEGCQRQEDDLLGIDELSCEFERQERKQRSKERSIPP